MFFKAAVAPRPERVPHKNGQSPVDLIAIPHEAGTCPLLRFVKDFYRPDLGVIHPRRESEQQFALAVGMETVELSDYRLECPIGSLKHIEVLKQQDAIARNIEDSTAGANAVCGWNH